MPFPDYTSLPQYDSILHLWKLDETSGTREDSKSDCDLADNNTVLYGTGRIGNGADFEAGQSEYLSATSDSSSNMDFTDSNFSISFWVKPETLPRMRFVWKQTTDKGWVLTYDEVGDHIKLYLYQSGVNQQVKSNVDIINAGVLTHVTVVRNGNTGYIYKDGSDDTSTSDTLIDPVTSEQPLYIGSSATPDRFVDGIMDELIVWNIALSSAEVSTLYNWYSKVGLSGAISFTGTIIKKPKKTLTGSISFTGSLTRLPKKLLTGAITFVGTLQKLPKKLLTGSISFTGTLITKVKKTLTGSISFIGQIFSPYLDGIWSLFIKRTATWTGKDKETTEWSAVEKEDTEWTEE